MNYDPSADETKTWNLTNDVLAALWLTIKGTVATTDWYVDDLLLNVTGIDVWFGGFNVFHYNYSKKAYVMNCMLKQNWGYLVADSKTVDDIVGITFPILFGAPYLNRKMALPYSKSNRKSITLDLDDVTTYLDNLQIDIHEVLLPGASPIGCIKQEEVSVEAKGTGDKDLWLQTNWDLLKLLLHSTTVPTGTAYTATLEQVGLEIDDFAWGYKDVMWETLHAEMMDELDGLQGVKNHIHGAVADVSDDTEHWIKNFGVLDFFYEKDLFWKAPLAGASTAKLKFNAGVDEAWDYAAAYYVPTAKLLRGEV